MADAAMIERRSATRRRTIIGGLIEQPGTRGTMSCMVRDLSPAGARLEFHNTGTVGDRFALVMPQKGRRAEARVVWRTFGEAGVAFDGPLATVGPDMLTQQEVERSRVSEARRHALEATLAQLSRTA